MLLLVGCAAPVFEGGELNRVALATVQQRTERAFGVALDAPLDIQVISRDQVREARRAESLRVYSDDALRAQLDAFTAVGIWPDGVGVEQAERAIEDQTAGFYEPKSQRLVLVRDTPIPWQILDRNAVREWVLSHELTHALQHQTHPDLFDHAEFFLGQSDLRRGLEGAIEGQAVLVATLSRGKRAAFPTPSVYATDMENFVAASAKQWAAVPALLRDTWYLPYVAGYRLAHAERNALLDDPPISSEQLLHADRRHQRFEAIDLAALRPWLPAGCRFVHEDSAGEVGLSVLLTDLAAQGDAPPAGAAEGWAGDRFLVARCGDRREFVWLLSWDSEADAIEFESAYAGVADAARLRAGLSGPQVVRRLGRDVQIASPALAPRSGDLFARVRRGRVATYDQLLAFFGESKVTQRMPGP